MPDARPSGPQRGREAARRAVCLFASVLVASLASGAVLAQESATRDRSSPVADFITRDRGADVGSPEVFPELPDVSGLDVLDPETRNAALAAVREYYRYRHSGYEHRLRVFEWQLQSSKIIFWVVILMVSAGIFFSGVQFHIALRAAAAATSAAVASEHVGPSDIAGEEPAAAIRAVTPETHAPTLYTTLEAGKGGIKVSSSVLGVIILVIAFLFFYLYLVHVYPISEIM